MLPLIVIGADEPTKQAIEGVQPPVPHVQFFDDTETAAYALTDKLGAAIEAGYVVNSGQHEPGLVEFDADRSAWRASVAYGPKVFGKAAIAQDVKLAHTGWTLVLTWATGDPSAPRRMIGGSPAGEDQSSIVWQAAPMLGANVIVDLTAGDPRGQVKTPGLVAMLHQMRVQVEP